MLEVEYPDAPHMVNRRHFDMLFVYVQTAYLILRLQHTNPVIPSLFNIVLMTSPKEVCARRTDNRYRRASRRANISSYLFLHTLSAESNGGHTLFK